LEHIIPAKYQKKAKGLLHFLSRYGVDVVSWKDNANVIYNRDVIQGSQISDLVKHVLIPHVKGNRIGFQQFYQVLKDIDTPTSFIHNKKMMEHPAVKSCGGYVLKAQTGGALPNYQPPRRRK
jgi:hypothetical protein